MHVWSLSLLPPPKHKGFWEALGWNLLCQHRNLGLPAFRTEKNHVFCWRQSVSNTLSRQLELTNAKSESSGGSRMKKSMCFEWTWDAEMRLGWGLCFLSLFSKKNKPPHLLHVRWSPHSRGWLSVESETLLVCGSSCQGEEGGPHEISSPNLWWRCGYPSEQRQNQRESKRVLPPWGRGTIWKEGMRSQMNRKRRSGQMAEPPTRWPVSPQNTPQVDLTVEHGNQL